MVACGDDNMRVIAKDHAFKIEVLRRASHDGDIDGQIPEGGDRLLAVSHRKAQVDTRMLLPEGRQSFRRKIFGRADHACRYAAALNSLELCNLLIAFGKKRLDPVCGFKENL